MQSFAAVPNTDDNLANLFSNFRKLAGGSLSQVQVDQINHLVSGFQQKAKSVSASGITLICSFEGLKLKAYDDGVGVWTIGFGTTIYPNGTKVKKGDTCTEAQAKAYMAQDLKKFEFAVNSGVTVPINQNQFDALISLTYNIGTGAFKESTLLKKLNLGDYKAAATQFAVWNKGGGMVMQGLVNRRTIERKLFEKAL
ncbi:lysozyme [Acinetobacter sp. 1207_04]|uniref:lysozyme n=1 Tax=Acinetobacter sp. 1207_04 TaxID=2604449 RepID=UPI0040598191